jgi:hypothetical protein
MSKHTPRATVPVVRCAVYTRKSTEEGLEQEFNSLDAQRESGELFVRSQAGEGWTVLADRYDDGGFTGGNMERPALQRLMADIEAGRIDCVLVYKVDRLSRSLLDFASMMETFEKHNVSFVSVTQQFNRRPRWGGWFCCRIPALTYRAGQRPVRAGDLLGTDPGQDRRHPPQGQVGRRPPDPRLRHRCQRVQAGGERVRGRAGPHDLPTLPRARVALARRAGAGAGGWTNKRWQT